MHEEFLEDWFGIHAGREILVLRRGRCRDYMDREFIEKPEQLIKYVLEQRKKRLPAYMSVQPYQARNQIFGIEKLFFEFDCKEDLSRAWKDAKILAETLIQYYNVKPFIKFSGRKGFHVDAYLRNVVQFPTFQLEFVKKVYRNLQQKILAGLKLETLDPEVIGDVKRLERIPFSTHEVTGKICMPVDLEGKPISVKSLDPYREQGLDTKVLEIVCREVKEREREEEAQARIRMRHSIKFDGKRIRPCISEALKKQLEGGGGHLMRLAVAVEFLNKGYSVDQVVSLFRSQRDFSERKTRYYVEDALKKHYKPFRCSTIKKLGYCLGDLCPFHRKRRP